MKFHFLCCLLALTALYTTGCGDDTDDFCEGSVSLEDYLDQNPQGQEVLTDDSGLRYIILEPGTPQRPMLTSEVTIKYTGTLTNDNVFDQTDGEETRTFVLGGLIEGWQIGLQLIGAGGKIRMFIPSELAYGPRQSGRICPNSDIIFDVEMVGWTDN